jgi:hypothetical protein
MAIELQSPPSAEKEVQAEALFKEARRRERRRRFGAVLVAAVLIATGITIGLWPNGRSSPARLSAKNSFPPGVRAAPEQLLFRPVLCYAPPYSGTRTASGGTASSGSLPATCPSPDLLAKPNLVGGSGSSNPYPNAVDVALSAYPSTTPAQGAQDQHTTVLLPGTARSGASGLRYLLGPAQLTGRIVESAQAQRTQNQGWVLVLHLTKSGSNSWNKMAKEYFHEVIAIEFDGVVQSAPITLPDSSTFVSFGPSMQVSGNFTRSSIQRLASAINADHSS